MKTTFRNLLAALAVASFAVFGLAACDDKSDAEKAIEEVGDKVEDAAEEVGDKVEDATD